MSPVNSVAPSLQAARRSHARRRINGLAYVEFGPDNGAILIDLGEGGLGFQSVMPVSMNQGLIFKFKLPGADKHIEGSAEVAWMNESGKGGGLRFVELATDACGQIREWTGVLPAPESDLVQTESAGESKPASEIASGKSAPADSTQSSQAQEAAPTAEDGPAPISEAIASDEDALAASVNAETDQPLADESAAKQVPVDLVALPKVAAIPEFTIEPAAASNWTQPAFAPVATEPPVIPPLTRAADLKQSESAEQHYSEPAQETAASAAKTAAWRATQAAAPAKSTRLPAPESKVSGSVQKRQRRPISPEPQAPALTSDRQGSPLHGSFTRQAQKSASAATDWENFTGPAKELTPQAALPPQVLQAGIGAAAGVGLMLALVFGVPHLRTLVQASVARSSGPNLVSPPAFQVEVADLNDHRWILKSDADAGSPFNDSSSRRDPARSQPVKSSQTDTSDESSRTVDVPKPKLPKPGELALSRPRPTQAPAASAQLIAPSIFDGITPPIGSVGDRLAVGGPEAPRIVPPESQPGIATSNLQAAVLVQRVAPVYPVTAVSARLQGEVQVNATIGKDGVPKELKVLKGDQRLVPAALAAIGQWRYRAATLGGQPIETQIIVSVDFHLQ
jgi:TonB family protein